MYIQNLRHISLQMVRKYAHTSFKHFTFFGKRDILVKKILVKNQNFPYDYKRTQPLIAISVISNSRALSICLHKDKRSNTNQLHIETGIPLLKDRRHRHLLNYMYKRKGKQNHQNSMSGRTRLFDAVVLDNITPVCDLSSWPRARGQ